MTNETEKQKIISEEMARRGSIAQANKTPEERSAHAKMMQEAREAKKTKIKEGAKDFAERFEGTMEDLSTG